ncbi:MAG TPA: serine peptidase, partial [Xanthobacteraceae bacterium]|nr:serine peptidase [Xanthobacteraceae bacterium]
MMLPNNRKSFSARRLVLMASVAAVGAALLVGGPGGYHANLPAWTAAASAADSTMQHPSGFADIVTKVKPAVISVRVKIPAS